MSFLNIAKYFVKSYSPAINLFKNNFTANIENIQTRSYKAEIFYHNRGLFSNDQSPRGCHYKAKVMKRVRTHGLETRLETRGGKQMLWKKILKGPRGWTQFVPAP